MLIEWEAHNIIGNVSFALGTLLFIPSLLTSSGDIDIFLWEIYDHCKDVYLENDRNWWKIWKLI
ncbi:MAG: hypothetical protein K2H06_01690 [Anaeroplasmataceae bacterium]|nr:hypothetical protein [Anaeroplasmataceae bacterium]